MAHVLDAGRTGSLIAENLGVIYPEVDYFWVNINKEKS